MYFVDLCNIDVHKATYDKKLSDALDKVKETEVHLKRKERDQTEFEGKLKYSSGNMSADEHKLVKAQLDTTLADLSRLQNDIKVRSQAVEDVTYTVNNLKTLWDDTIAAMRKELGSSVAPGAELLRSTQAATQSQDDLGDGAPGRTPTPPAEGDGEEGEAGKKPSSASRKKSVTRQVAVMSFRDGVEKILVELGTLQELRLTMYEGVADDVPHFTSWDQRTSAAIFAAKGKVTDVQNSLVGILNGISAAFPDLATSESGEKWTMFVTWVDEALRNIVQESVKKAFWIWERQITGKAAREVFSINLKLGANCRLVFVPLVGDMPKLVGDVVEKVFTICPENAVSDFVSARTNSKSGKGSYLETIKADKDITNYWQSIKIASGLFAEELIAFVSKCEERFEYLWAPDMTALNIEELRKGMDKLEFEFINKKVINNAVLLNAFPMQDAVLSMCAAQLAKLKEQQYQDSLTDAALKAKMSDTTMATCTSLPKQQPVKKMEKIDIKGILAKAMRLPQPNSRMSTPREGGAKKSTPARSPVAAAPSATSEANTSPAPKQPAQKDPVEVRAQAEVRPAVHPAVQRGPQPESTQAPSAHSPTTNFAQQSSPRPSTTPIGTRTSLDGSTSASQQREKPQTLTPQKYPRGPSQEQNAVPSSTQSQEVVRTSLYRDKETSGSRSSVDRESSAKRVWETPEKKTSTPSSSAHPAPAPLSYGNSPTPATTTSGANESPYARRGSSSSNSVVASNGSSPYGQRAKPRRIIAKDGDSDEAIIQRLLQREKESLERIKRQKETDDEKRARSEKEEEQNQAVMAEAQRQAALEHARREDQERERVRMQREQERKAKESQKRLEDELEKRLEEEMRRRAAQQQKEKEEREAHHRAQAIVEAKERQEKEERLERERQMELKRIQDMEAVRQQEAQRKKAPSPPTAPPASATQQPAFVRRNNDATNSTDSALRRKLALPPVAPRGGSLGPEEVAPVSAGSPLGTKSTPARDNGDKTPSPVDIPVVGEKKPSTAPAGGSTPRGRNSSTTSSVSSVNNPTPLSSATKPQQQPPASTTAKDDQDQPRSLLEEYRGYCSEFGIKPNSGLLKTLPRQVGENISSINLDLNYIGVKGVQPLLQILKRNRGLKLLNLKDNNLENNEIRALVGVLLTESGDQLQHLDLSNNPISLAGGSALMDLVTRQRSLTKVVLRGTLIQPKVVDSIVTAAENNATQ